MSTSLHSAALLLMVGFALANQTLHNDKGVNHHSEIRDVHNNTKNTAVSNYFGISNIIGSIKDITRAATEGAKAILQGGVNATERIVHEITGGMKFALSYSGGAVSRVESFWIINAIRLFVKSFSLAIRVIGLDCISTPPFHRKFQFYLAEVDMTTGPGRFCGLGRIFIDGKVNVTNHGHSMTISMLHKIWNATVNIGPIALSGSYIGNISTAYSAIIGEIEIDTNLTLNNGIIPFFKSVNITLGHLSILNSTVGLSEHKNPLTDLIVGSIIDTIVVLLPTVLNPVLAQIADRITNTLGRTIG